MQLTAESRSSTTHTATHPSSTAGSAEAGTSMAATQVIRSEWTNPVGGIHDVDVFLAVVVTVGLGILISVLSKNESQNTSRQDQLSFDPTFAQLLRGLRVGPACARSCSGCSWSRTSSTGRPHAAARHLPGRQDCGGHGASLAARHLLRHLLPRAGDARLPHADRLHSGAARGHVEPAADDRAQHPGSPMYARGSPSSACPRKNVTKLVTRPTTGPAPRHRDLAEEERAALRHGRQRGADHAGAVLVRRPPAHRRRSSPAGPGPVPAKLTLVGSKVSCVLGAGRRTGVCGQARRSARPARR